MRRSSQKIIDFISFPFRAFTLFEKDRFGLSSLQTERYDYVAKEVKGYCLDIGCGRNNRFINDFVKGNGVGIDVFKFEGLKDENIVKDMTKLPFQNGCFNTVTLIANINHISYSIRDKELKEIYRVVAKNGRIIVTMGNPIVEILVHKIVWAYNKFFKIKVDIDSERGMEFGEKYYLTDDEIIVLLTKAGFKNIKKKYFGTQWGLNHMFISTK